MAERRRRFPSLRNVAILGVGLLAGVGLLGCSVFSIRGHRGPPTAHFDGTRFRNQVHHEPAFLDFWRWMLNREAAEWPDWIDGEPGPPPPTRVDGGEVRVTFVNHATALIQLDGVNVLTDPVWSDRVGPLEWLGPKRHRAPGIRFEDLPPIDLVLISHAHYDHLDLPTLERLSAGPRKPRIVTGLGIREFLLKRGVGAAAVELDWWQALDVAGLRITMTPAAHWSNRGLGDARKSLWGGYVIEGPAGGRVFFAGDTGHGPHFAQIRERFGPPRVALLPIGAFRPRWFMQRHHLSPADAILAHRELGAGVSVPIHFGTFALADDGPTEPADELRRLLAVAGEEAPLFAVLAEGEGFAVPPPPAARAAADAPP